MYNRNKSHWKLKLFLFLLVICVINYGLMCLFPSIGNAVKNDIKQQLGLVETKQDGSDSTVILSNTSSVVEEPLEEAVTIPFEFDGNVAYVMAKVNGIDVKFLLDTGCSTVLMTSAELYYLHHMGKMDVDNVSGKTTCRYGDGSEGDGYIYLIDSLSIGGIKLDSIECTVIENAKAEPLLGQTILSKFGKVSIDYKNKKIKINKNAA